MPSPLSLYKELTRRSQKYLRELDPRDVELVRRYQEASDINSLLRSGALQQPPRTPWHATRLDEAEILDRVLREAPTLPEDLTVFRAAPSSAYPGTEQGFLSTSFDRRGASDFLDALNSEFEPATMHRISVQNGTPYLAPHDLVEEYVDQRELIFPRGARLLRNEEGGLDFLRGKYAAGGVV